ncbi:hypothetical protein NE237_014149 [Protea cynaroides]|uniref:Uncharacterized protein n=1 Tax=Protea cynaroides TaxID=273540 RepID=A0A9Q0JTL3_9MAGN|nr:hypothetical protein NE237_014149 [Protea cynaroides]
MWGFVAVLATFLIHSEPSRCILLLNLIAVSSITMSWQQNLKVVICNYGRKRICLHHPYTTIRLYVIFSLICIKEITDKQKQQLMEVVKLTVSFCSRSGLFSSIKKGGNFIDIFPV